MNSERMRRANRAVYPAIAVLLGYVVLILVGFMLTTGGTTVTYVQIGVSAVAYAVIVIIGNSSDAFAYAFPILFATMAYLNIRMIAVGNGIIVVANIVRLVSKYGSAAKEEQQSLFYLYL